MKKSKANHSNMHWYSNFIIKSLGLSPWYFRYFGVTVGCLCLGVTHIINIMPFRTQQQQIQAHIMKTQKKIAALHQHLEREKNISTLLKRLKTKGIFKTYYHFEMAGIIYEIAALNNVLIEAKNLRFYPDKITLFNKEMEIKETVIQVLIQSINLKDISTFMEELQQKYPLDIKQESDGKTIHIVWYSLTPLSDHPPPSGNTGT